MSTEPNHDFDNKENQQHGNQNEEIGEEEKKPTKYVNRKEETQKKTERDPKKWENIVIQKYHSLRIKFQCPLK